MVNCNLRLKTRKQKVERNTPTAFQTMFRLLYLKQNTATRINFAFFTKMKDRTSLLFSISVFSRSFSSFFFFFCLLREKWLSYKTVITTPHRHEEK